MVDFSSKLKMLIHSLLSSKNGDDSTDFSDLTPQRGERVDSINYYNRQLALINDKLARMQHEKIELAQKGDKSFRPSQMISSAIERVTDVAEMTFVRIFK